MDVNEVVFDESTRSFIAEINLAMADAVKAQIAKICEPFALQKQAVMQLAIRKNGLPTEWAWDITKDKSGNEIGMTRPGAPTAPPPELPPSGDFTRKSRK